MVEPTTFFIDESGNTGDISTVKGSNYLSEQRMFALAAVGCTLANDIGESFAALKAQHRLQSSEFKAKHTYNKPRFLADLLSLIERHRLPVFIELVDKHYFIVMNIIERMVMPYAGPMDLDDRAMWVKGKMADYMALHAPRRLAVGFASCCQSRNYNEINQLYRAITEWAQHVNAYPTEISNAIARETQDSWRDFQELPRDEAIQRALPIPDSNTSGKMIWVLPNLSSFTHIYARINLFKNRHLEGVSLFHDEQLQFGDIFLNNKRLAEGLARDGVRLRLKTADFEFSEKADFKFLKSHESLGIQIADVLAGFMTRYVQDAVWSGKPIRSDKADIFARLVAIGTPSRGTGVNIVAPDNLIRFLGIVPTPNY